MVGTVMGADEAELARRKRELLAAVTREEAGEDWFTTREQRWIIGTPERCREMVRRFAAAGIERIMVQDFLPRDLEMVDLVGRELVGRV
jgi:alkanesulfonate monooxygenase SsuD/methylene tetrahydromethanopterin reductase-like flavin-dependent oxidoreductase (luciferase family)